MRCDTGVAGFLTTESQSHREKERQKDPRTGPIVGAAIEVHRALGPGLLESAYEECLCHELNLRRLAFQRQADLPVPYKGLKLDCGYKMDVVVADEVILELKSIEKILPSSRGTTSYLHEAIGETGGAPDQLQRAAIDAGNYPKSFVISLCLCDSVVKKSCVRLRGQNEYY
jgi:GxxExxY protein